MRNSCIIYRSFYEAIKELPAENQAEIWNAVFEFALNFRDPELTGLSRSIFTLIRPNLEANQKKYENGLSIKNKQKGSKREAKHKQTGSKTEANANVDVDVDVNVDVDKKVNVDVNENDKEEINTTSSDSQKSEPENQFKKTKPDKAPEPQHQPCKKVFMDFFKERNGLEYYWRGRDGKAINEIIKQIRSRGTEDKDIPTLLQTLLNKIEDKWILSNLDVSLLNSKFNQIITKIKNENKQLSYEDIAAEYKRRDAAKRAAVL